MRLAILGSRGIPARYGGFETFAEELSTRLVARGVEVTVYCEAGGGDIQSSHKGVNLVYISSPKLGPFTTILFDLRCLWHARKGFDVVYMLGYGASLFCFLPRLWRSKVWINMDGIEWQRAKWGNAAKVYFKLMEAIAVRLADLVIADAEGIRRFLEERHGAHAACAVIPYGATLVERDPARDVLREYALQPYRYYLVVCRLEPENHVGEIVQGFVSSGSTSTLVVIGDRAADTEYIRKINQVGDKRIRLAGVLYDHEKLTSLRYYCRAYLHGHSVGGTNPSLLEALGCGNPVIAHDNAFNREVAGDAAFYFRRSGEVGLLIEKIESWDDGQRARLSSSARQRVRDAYTWEMVADAYFQRLNGC